MRAGFVAIVLAAAPAIAEPKLEHLGTFVWDRPESYFGGWSAIEVADGGNSFVAIGDNAQLYDGTFEREQGLIVAVPRRPVGALTDMDGIAYFKKGETELADSEGLALLPDGQRAISFERDHRILIYRGDAAISRVPDNADAVTLPSNRGVEALAVDVSARLIAIPEAIPPGAPGFPVWRLDGDTWTTVFHIPRTLGFNPVGADIDTNNRLFLLERAFRFVGFQNRIRIFDMNADDPKGIVIWQPAMAEYDNLEGLSVWLDRAGVTHLTMISDDNNNRFQETQIVEFRLTE